MRIYTENSDFIFLKWATRNRWPKIGNHCRSNLYLFAILSSHQSQSETAWHNVICSGPNFITRKLCLHISYWNISQPDITKFTKTDAEVENKMKHLYNTTRQASWSLLNFFLYSEHNNLRLFATIFHTNPLGTLRPIYRTGVKLPSRCSILYLFNKYPY